MTDQLYCTDRFETQLPHDPRCQKLRSRDSDGGCSRVVDYRDGDRSLDPVALKGIHG